MGVHITAPFQLIGKSQSELKGESTSLSSSPLSLSSSSYYFFTFFKAFQISNKSLLMMRGKNRRISVLVIVIIIVKTFLDDNTTSRLSTYLRRDLTMLQQQYLLTVTNTYVLASIKRNRMKAHDPLKGSDRQ